MSRKVPQLKTEALSSEVRVGIVAARFNADVVEALLDGCRKRLKELGLVGRQIEIFRVPGAFELPVAAQTMARTGRFDAIICLGAVVRGETPHFEYVAGQCASGVSRVGLDEGLPVLFGVLTTNNEEQAWIAVGASTVTAVFGPPRPLWR